MHAVPAPDELVLLHELKAGVLPASEALMLADTGAHLVHALRL